LLILLRMRKLELKLERCLWSVNLDELYLALFFLFLSLMDPRNLTLRFNVFPPSQTCDTSQSDQQMVIDSQSKINSQLVKVFLHHGRLP
jgi:hypothetical protein